MRAVKKKVETPSKAVHLEERRKEKIENESRNLLSSQHSKQTPYRSSLVLEREGRRQRH